MNLCRTAVCLVSAMIAIVSAKADSPRYDVYLLIGQSNMCGRGPLPVTPYDLTNVQIWNGSAWVQAVEPFFHDTGTAGAGLAASFARKMADAEPGVIVRLVPAALGDTAMSRWVPEGDLYKAAVAKTKGAIAAGGGTLKGILWHQGEGDAGNYAIASSYAANLKRMVGQFRTDLADLTGGGSLRFVAGELGRYFGDPNNGHCAYWQTVNNQLRKAAKEMDDAYLVSSEGLAPKDDNIHFDTPSLRTLGERYSVAFLNPSALPVLEPPPPEASDPSKNVSTLDYVQDGLVAQWDGLENAGRFRHAADITVWKDLIGGSEIQLGSGNAAVGKNFLQVLKGKAISGTCPELGIDRAKTIEICARCTAIDDGNEKYLLLNEGHKYIYSSSASSGWIFTYDNGNSCRVQKKGVSKVDTTAPHTFSCGYPGTSLSLNYDGKAASISNAGDVKTSGRKCSEAFQLGRDGRPAAFEFYSVRIYSRVLTADEIKRNYEVDIARFVDGKAGWCDVLCVRSTSGEVGTSSPAYGCHKDVPGGANFVCSVECPIPVGQTNVVCAGYVVYTNGAYGAGQEYLAGTESAFDYVQPVNAAAELVWRITETEDATLPLVINLTAESVKPDELTVRGDLAAMTGASCTLSVIVSGGGLSEPLVFEGLAGSERTATGEFELTVVTSDPDDPRYLHPNVTYEVKVLAQTGAKRSSSEATAVKMLMAISAASYVQDGLVAQWDGIENAGPGRHAASPAEWVDLVGTNRIALISGAATVYDNHVSVAAKKQIGGTCPEMANKDGKPMPIAIELFARTDRVGAANGYMFFADNFRYIQPLGGNSGYRIYYLGRLSSPKNERWIRDTGADLSSVDQKYHTFSQTYLTPGMSLSVDGENFDAKLKSARKETDMGYTCTAAFALGKTDRDTAYSYRSLRIYSRSLTAVEIRQNRWIDRIRFEDEPVEDVLPDGVRMLADGTIQCRTEVDAHGVGVRSGGTADAFVEGRHWRWKPLLSVVTVEADPKAGRLYAWVGAPRTGATWADDGATMSWALDGALSLYLDAFEPSDAVRHVAPGASESFASLRGIKSLHIGALQGETGVATCQLCEQVEVTAANGGYVIVETKVTRSVRGSVFTLLRGGKLKLLADAIVNDLEMPDAADALDLNGHTLTIRSMKHRDRTGWKGTVVDSAGDGQVVWNGGAGMVLMVN